MKKVLILLIEGFEIFEASAFIDVLGWNQIDGNKETEFLTCGLKKEVKSTFNQRLIVDRIIDEINADDFDALAIPGGFEEYHFYKNAYDNRISELIQTFNDSNKIIASICTGAFPIAKSGVLEGKKGTTYNLNPVRQENLKRMGVVVMQKPIVIEEHIITSWNPSTAVNVAFLLLEKLTNKENSDLIKKNMGFA